MEQLIGLENYIFTSRIRLARNIAGYPFKILEPKTSQEFVQKSARALKNHQLNLFYMRELSDYQKELLKEKNLISVNLIKNTECGAVLISQDESLSIMINEEDVIREQCFMHGLKLQQCYERLNSVDDKLNKTFTFCYDERLGYLTACPTNVGTGMRASVMMFLPALTELGLMPKIIQKLNKKGMTVRGIYGEGSNAEGYIYQISNEVTLGVSEQQIINAVTEAVYGLYQSETQAESNYLKVNELEIKDKCFRALAISLNCLLLSYEEFIKNLSYIKEGILFNVLKVKDYERLNNLIFEMRPARLCQIENRNLSAKERDFVRASKVREVIKKTVKVSGEINV